MENCHFFKSEARIKVMSSLANVSAYAEMEDVKEAEISKCISFCTVILKTTVLIADSIFDHRMNECIFLHTLERKVQASEKEHKAKYNENTVKVLIRGISVVACIEFWKIFLVQRDMLVQQRPQFYELVLNYSRSEFLAMAFDFHVCVFLFPFFSFRNSFIVVTKK